MKKNAYFVYGVIFLLGLLCLVSFASTLAANKTIKGIPAVSISESSISLL